MLYRTIDSLAVVYGKGKLTCFLGDINGVVDAVSFCLALILQNGKGMQVEHVFDTYSFRILPKNSSYIRNFLDLGFV